MKKPEHLNLWNYYQKMYNKNNVTMNLYYISQNLSIYEYNAPSQPETDVCNLYEKLKK